MRVVAALIALSFVPAVASVARVGELALGAEVTPDNARFFADPVPVLVHVICAATFCILGALQFVPGLRRRRWHRWSGRVLIPAGLAAALAALWMTLVYDFPARDNALLEVFRLLFGSLWAVALVLAFRAIRRGDVARHRMWMLRGYAIAQGAGTQVILLLPVAVVAGAPAGMSRALLMGAAWVINLVVAERVLRRNGTPSGVIEPVASAQS